MADINMRYDHPTYIARGSSQLECLAGTANTVAARFKAFAAMKVKSIRAHVVVAGTADAAALTVNQNGTDSVGAVSVGTATAGSELTALTDVATLARGEYLEFLRIATSGATMATQAVIEYELIPGASVES